MFCSAVLSRMRMQKYCFTTYTPNFYEIIFSTKSLLTDYNSERLIVTGIKKIKQSLTLQLSLKFRRYCLT